MGQPAKVLAPADVRRVLKHVRCKRNAIRNHAMVMLSFKAGLRACEIAGLDWSMVLRADGKLGTSIMVSGSIAKNGTGRRIPMNPDLAKGLQRLFGCQGEPRSGAVIKSERGNHMTPRSVVNWFRETYAELGLEGCSSHSGRRTFITMSARLLPKIGGSLRDVQELAGHRSITTTERYIEGDRDVQRRLLRLI